MTDDRNAIPGDLSPYGHKTLARCLHHHEPIGRYLDMLREDINAAVDRHNARDGYRRLP